MSKLIKILFLAANPDDSAKLKLDEEMRSIDQALRQTEYRDKFDIKQHWAVRVTELQNYFLRHKPDIVHFSGHGSLSSEIILQDNHGNSQPVSSRALSQLFLVLKDNIRCVVLNACFTQQQAQAIAKHIDCVIGMSKAIGDSAAISFATAFYQALGYGRDVKTAFDLGCLQIDLENLNEQDIPKLVVINKDPQEIVFVPDIVDDISYRRKGEDIPIVGAKPVVIESATIGGDIAGRDITHFHGDIHIEHKKKDGKKSWIETTQAKLTLAATILGIIVTVFTLKDHFIRAMPSSRFQTKVVDSQTRFGVPGVIIVLSQVENKYVNDTTTTSSDGSFLFKVDAMPGTKIRLLFEHPDYVFYDAYFETENPKIIQLSRRIK